jgi:hypothetical protein
VVAVKITVVGVAVAVLVCGWLVTLAKLAARRDRR